MAQIDALLKSAVQARVSDVHIPTGSPFVFRQVGKLRKVKSSDVTPDQAKNLIYEILTPHQRKALEQNLQIDFSYEIKGLARFRGNVILQRKGLDATFRLIFDSVDFPRARNYLRLLLLKFGIVGNMLILLCATFFGDENVVPKICDWLLETA